jgi:hypothetical protein
VFAATLLGVAILPLAVYGFISLFEGAFFLPNSVILKGNAANLTGPGGSRILFGGRLIEALRQNPHLFILLVGGFLALARQLRLAGRLGARGWMLLLFLGALLAHLEFSRSGQLVRYEAYLMFTGTLLLLVELLDIVSGWYRGPGPGKPGSLASLLAAIGLCAAPLISTGGEALLQAPIASQNIHQQQYQMARFLAGLGHVPVVANDIGAVSYYSGVSVVDPEGLATKSIARMRLARRYNTDSLSVIVREEGARLAVVYDMWIYRDGGVPAGWKALASWSIVDNVICGEPLVTFYATAPEFAPSIREDLAKFKALLPAGVSVADL